MAGHGVTLRPHMKTAKTVEAAELTEMNKRGEIKNCVIDGPLSMDCAVIPAIAKTKGSVSEVAGKADILIAPNIETASGVYSAMTSIANAKAGGLIAGGIVPISYSIRSDSIENYYYSIMLGSLSALKA